MDARKSAIFAFASKAKPLAFAGFLHPLREFGAKKYFTDHHTPNTRSGFGDSFLVCKMHDCYCRIRKNVDQHSFLLIEATQAMTMDRLDENKPLQNVLNVFLIIYRLFYF